MKPIKDPVSSFRDVIKSADLDYKYFEREAYSIVRELQNPRPSEPYIKEKVKHVLRLFDDHRDELIRIKLYKCVDCGKFNGRKTICPYMNDVHNVEHKKVLCKVCEKERADCI